MTMMRTSFTIQHYPPSDEEKDIIKQGERSFSMGNQNKVADPALSKNLSDMTSNHVHNKVVPYIVIHHTFGCILYLGRLIIYAN